MSSPSTSFDVTETAARATRLSEARTRLAEETRDQLWRFATQSRAFVEHMPNPDINLYGPGRTADFKLLKYRVVNADPADPGPNWIFEGVAIHKGTGEVIDFRSTATPGERGETPGGDELLEWAPRMSFVLESTAIRRSAPYTPVFPLDEVFGVLVNASIHASVNICSLESEVSQKEETLKDIARKATTIQRPSLG